jgi:hypothetical protein
VAEHQDRDRGVIDSVKDALGIGEDDEARRERERAESEHYRERGAPGAGVAGGLPGDTGVAGAGRGERAGTARGAATGGTGTGGTMAGRGGGMEETPMTADEGPHGTMREEERREPEER